MKVGDLVVYNFVPGAPGLLEEPKDVAVVVAARRRLQSSGVHSFLMFYPHYNDYVIGWEDEYRVYSEGR